jgi:outer membrane biosynthesis protein TonB
MKRPVKKVKRFDGGGYTGDDPIVKYRMGQMSEADTYEALGQKDLADASRAKEPKVEPKVESKPTIIESSEETGNKGVATETPKPAAPKPAPKPATKLAPKPVVKTETKEKAEPKVNGKTFSETISSSKSKDQEDKKLSAAEIAKIQREGISGKQDTDQKMPEPKSAGKKFREFFGSKYKEGGTVKRSSASSRGDGIATKGHTRGKIC